MDQSSKLVLGRKMKEGDNPYSHEEVIGLNISVGNEET